MHRIARLSIATLIISAFMISAVIAQPYYNSREDYMNRTPSVVQLDRAPQSKIPANKAASAVLGEPDIDAVWTGATQWMSGISHSGGETFDGSLGKGKDFFGSNLGDGDYVTVQIIFETGAPNQTLCQTFRRDLGYASAGVGTFPGQAWDVSNPGTPRRLNICYVEDNNLAAANLAWDPNGVGAPTYGKREYVFIMLSDYDGTGTTYAGLNINSGASSMDVLYGWWPLVAGGSSFFENEPCTLTVGAYYVRNFVGIPDENQVILDWNYAGAPALDHFSIYGDVFSPPTTLLAQVSSTTTRYTAGGLTNGNTYYFRVEADDAARTIVAESKELSVTAQSVSQSITLLDFWNGRSLYGDCWGYVDTATDKEYALICARNEGVSIIDINVTPAVEVGFMPAIVAGNDAKDVKIYKNYAILISEYENGQIFDITDVTNPVQISQIVSEGGSGAHNCIVDGDYLYVVGNHSVGGVEIFDISNPAAPNNVGDFEPFYYHDLDIHNDTLIGAGIYGDGLDLIDVSNKAAPAFIQQFNYATSGAHNCEFIQGMNYVAIGDEIGGSPHTRIFDLQNLGAINKVADIIIQSGQPTHNSYVKNDILYIAHYALGVRLINVADPTKPKEVGFYDTYLENTVGYVGAWNVYPYFPSGKFIVSDMQTGLYVLELSVEDSCLIQMPGDANGNGVVEIADVVALNAFLENTGPAPIPLANGDYNGDCIINQADADELLDTISFGVGQYQIVECTCLEPTVELNCCIGNRGDCNNDGNDANILDLNFLVNRIFRSGPNPACAEEGDVNSDGNSANILDLNFLVNRIFRSGPAPGPC